MFKIVDTFGVTKEELETIQTEASRIAALGYKVPNIEIKFIHNAQGMAGKGTIYIHPNTDLEALRFCVAHEIGHHNEPETEINLWDEETWDFAELEKKSEDFANWFAVNI